MHTFKKGDRAVVSNRYQGKWREGYELPEGVVVTIKNMNVSTRGDIEVFHGTEGSRYILASALDPIDKGDQTNTPKVGQMVIVTKPNSTERYLGKVTSVDPTFFRLDNDPSGFVIGQWDVTVLPDPADEVIVRASALPEVTWHEAGGSWWSSSGTWVLSKDADLDLTETIGLRYIAAVRAERARRAAEKPEPDPAQVAALAALMPEIDEARTPQDFARALLATGKITVKVEP